MAIIIPIHFGSSGGLPTSWGTARLTSLGFPRVGEDKKPPLPLCLTFAAATPAKPDQKGRGGSMPAAAEKTEYKDNWFDLLAIRHLSTSIQATSGLRSQKKGYESLMEAAIMVSRKYEAKEQQQVAMQSLSKAFPIYILKMIKNLLPESKFSRELCAAFTKLFFTWLVGHSEVRARESAGVTEKNVVYVRKCRFLESTKCAGICTNMCKIPTQKFILDSLGMPVYIIPNYEDMSCEMIFGQHPPADDPALMHPCYHKLCIVKQTGDE